VCAWLVLRKEWRALPWCLFGFVFYALLTTVVWGEPLWFWTSDPYQNAGGIYGSGPWNFFVHRAEQVIGRPLLTLGVLALVLWPVIWWPDRTERRTHLMMLITEAAPALGIVLIHSCFGSWARADRLASCACWSRQFLWRRCSQE